MTSAHSELNCYTVLDIPEKSTVDEINAAYKRLVLIHHPDKTRGDEASILLFHQIQQAVEVLRDPESRSRHDEALRSRSRITNRNVSTGNRRYFPADDRRNWSQDERPWSATPRKTWNFNDPWERYLYTYGTGVHMDPNSEVSRAERARHAHDIEDWERRYAGFDPDLERMMRDIENQGTEAVQRPKEMTENNSPTEEAKKANEYMKSKEAGDPRQTNEKLGKQSTIGHRTDGIRPGVMIDLMTDMPSTPIPFYPGVVDDCLIDLSDSEQPSANRGHAISKEHGHVDTNSSSHNNETPTREDVVKTITEKNAAEILQPFVPFFSEKFKKYSSLYSARDMREEMQGLILETYSSSLETIVQHSLANTQPSKATGRQPCSSHFGAWERTSGALQCPKCQLCMPVFSLTCPGCGRTACIRCKFSGGTS
ncbi:uncharacterized protein N7483_010014 [Penicillium malachiteum]|uniref:uncharacterized protein n=1 Tax=Penicillium malachiteum TaxID=1324776 RepID=UPI00254674AB|nr:uncharacterized protein N7483_010014 [Penicillium malachiteum]KAJ5718932.1 hypothetical protein N7483_010014 [Penicillium malachiteum]